MKKIMFLLVSVLVVSGLAGCDYKNKENTPDVLSNDAEDMPTNQLSCADSIKNYLADADMVGAGDEVTTGNTVVVHYVGRLDAENVFDTSVEVIAKACGSYNAMRDYNEGLSFEVGAGQMIPGFDKGVQGMKVGQTKTITIPAAAAYGEWTQDAIVTMPRDQIPNSDQFTKGMEVTNAYGQKMKIYDVTDTDIVFDTNHELAGKDLIFDITVLEVK